MNLEIYLNRLRQIERPSNGSNRTALLTGLRQVPTEIDTARSNITQWQGRGKIFFHSLQDLRWMQAEMNFFRDELHLPESQRMIRSAQACFVKDLDRYLQFFPSTEQTMRSVFESILSVGTSAPWNINPGLPLALLPVYTQIDEEIIRPWVAEEKAI